MKRRKRSDKRCHAQSSAKTAWKRRRKRQKKAIRIHGLTRQQHAFVREKILGMNDKDAAIAAGYALSVAENTKQKLWTARAVQSEFERLRKVFEQAWRKILPELDAARSKATI